MEITKAEALAKKLMEKHGLSSWSFSFDRAKTRFGVCNFTRKKISLSRYFTSLNSEAIVKDTILHEIAHAIAGKSAGHGKIWKAVAKKIGATPRRCFDCTDVLLPKMKWTVSCKYCGKIFQRNKKSNLICSSCAKGDFFGRLTGKYLMDWKENE